LNDTESGIRPIRKLAVVNRGEAAMRCIRAVKALRAVEDTEIEVLALYTDSDSDAPFVRHADSSIALPSAAGGVAAYLDHDHLLKVLAEWGADAVWPGWGFVAEDPEFVTRLEEAGIRFLGPSAEAMRALGDKITSKRIAEQAGVPVTDWSGGALADEHEAAQHASRIGYPVIIKATAGGGGRGIRVVEKEAEIAEAFRSASSEAQSAFGNGDLFCEKLVTGGRHIEVQIAADQHGNVMALGCRDCSVQRRHQKVLEEAPPPWLDARVREGLEQASVQLARHVGYQGVGTVEFLLGDDGFFFLEVNPRLQVEHGITEEIVGVDLVQIQVRIARGDSIAGIEIKERGVAIEARVCAEDPDANFLPSPGQIVRFDPALGPRIRIDSGVVLGTTVSSEFDSLIAKVIATGDNRDEALARLKCALQDFELVIEGGANNKGYLIEILGAEAYRSGPVDTTWLDRWNEGRQTWALADTSESQDALVAGAIVAYQRSRQQARDFFYSDTAGLSRERIPPSQGQQVDLTYAGEAYRLMVYAIGAWRYRVHLGDRAVAATLREEGAYRARLIIDERVRRVVYDLSDLGLRLEVDGRPYRYGLQTAGQVRSGSPSMVVAVSVEEGETVEAGQGLGILEAMKMEIGFQSPVSGTVSEVRVRPGQQVAAGEVLLVIDSSNDSEETSGRSEAIELPGQRDPLSALFEPDEENVLGIPTLEAANANDPLERQNAMQTVREEVRRVVLGFDANPDRTRRLVSFLEAPLPANLSEDFKRELADVRHEMRTFAITEEIFSRAPSDLGQGELGPSNDARFRMYVRRIRASGTGIADDFLDKIKIALSQYGVTSLETGDALERAVLRMLSAQRDPALRYRLMLGVTRRLTALADASAGLSADIDLSRALELVAHMRPQVGDALADAALEASYRIYRQPGIEARAARTSKVVDEWLSASETEFSVPPAGVLREVAAAPRRVFDRVGHWIMGDDSARREIALAAHIQRRYAPRIAEEYSTTLEGGSRIHCLRYKELGLVLAVLAGRDNLMEVFGYLCKAAQKIAAAEEGTVFRALEVVVPPNEALDFSSIREEFEAQIVEGAGGRVVTLGLLGEEGGIDHVFKTWESDGGKPVLRALYDLHPETAERIGLARYVNFELERTPAEEGVYAFVGHAREVPGDERVFVLADARDRASSASHELAVHLPAFEQTFQRATRSLRTILQVHDGRRRLRWNRIALYVAPAIFVDSKSVERIASQLAPATRHLGLEKVLVRLNLLDRENPEAPPVSQELEIFDANGRMEIAARAPHREPLVPASSYERKLVATRRQGQPYPYEILKMLVADDRASQADKTRPGTTPSSPAAFAEFDLDPESSVPRAIPIGDRPYGGNQAAVVLGLISTPTAKHPEGMRRVLVLSDASMGMGALSAPECDRLVAAFDLAEKESLPLEWVSVSSGARIAMDSGTENLDATARVVRRIVTFTQAGGIVNLLVAGVNIGAQSYFDALATMLMHTRGALIMTPDASMVLTGRRALEAAGSVSAEDEVAIGGYERIMGPNGEAQYHAPNLFEAYEILYRHYEFTYTAPGESGPRRLPSTDPDDRSICDFEIPSDSFGFATVGEIFDDSKNPGRKRPFGMRTVMQAVIDSDGGQLERWQAMVGAETTIVWDAHLGGFPVELIGIESHSVIRNGYRPHDGPEAWNGGTLFPQSSKKMARAINAASGIRPVVILANLSGFDGSPESLRKLQLEYGAEIARAVVNFEGPILFCVVSRYHGGAYVVFSQALNPSLESTALTGSYASVIGGGPAASVVFAREVRSQAVSDSRVVEMQRELRVRPSAELREKLEVLVRDVTLEKQAEVAAEFDRVHSVERAREVGSLRDIMEPQDMRRRLIDSLRKALEGTRDRAARAAAAPSEGGKNAGN
jgi:acetyl/propionyl-CoA carboxylase alpha subunit/acetyl-CoA carboxylase carboxyltransferase component